MERRRLEGYQSRSFCPQVQRKAEAWRLAAVGSAGLFDEVFTAEDIRVLLAAPQAPRINAIMERWVGSVRRELLDRLLIVNARHLRKVLAEYETHFNTHRPHRALNQASPLRAPPDSVDADIKVTRRDRLGGLLHEYAQVA